MSETIAYAALKAVLFAPILVPVSDVMAIVAGLSILLGYRAKFGAWLAAFSLVCVTPAVHNFWTVTDPAMHQIELIQFLKNLSMLGGALLITQVSSGAWSLDQHQSSNPFSFHQNPKASELSRRVVIGARHTPTVAKRRRALST